MTPGVIDVHSHLGDYPSPGVEAHQRRQRDHLARSGPKSGPSTASGRRIRASRRALANGGITTLQVLPGSANLFGGRGVTLRNVPARTVQAMRFPGAPRGLKLACGENPKRVYGGRNQMPQTRMGNVALDARRPGSARSNIASAARATATPRATSRSTPWSRRWRATSSSTTIATAPTRWR